MPPKLPTWLEQVLQVEWCLGVVVYLQRVKYKYLLQAGSIFLPPRTTNFFYSGIFNSLFTQPLLGNLIFICPNEFQIFPRFPFVYVLLSVVSKKIRFQNKGLDIFESLNFIVKFIQSFSWIYSLTIVDSFTIFNNLVRCKVGIYDSRLIKTAILH